MEPSPELAEQIFPPLEHWVPRFANRAAKKTWAEGGLDEDDVTGQRYCTLLTSSRSIFLQDMAVLQPDFPSLPFFSMDIFDTPAWAAFSSTVRAAHTENSLPRSLLLERALPDLSSTILASSNALRGGQGAIVEQVREVSRQLQGGEDQLNNTLAIILSNQARILSRQERLQSALSGPMTFQFGSAASEVKHLISRSRFFETDKVTGDRWPSV